MNETFSKIQYGILLLIILISSFGIMLSRYTVYECNDLFCEVPIYNYNNMSRYLVEDGERISYNGTVLNRGQTLYVGYDEAVKRNMRFTVTGVLSLILLLIIYYLNREDKRAYKESFGDEKRN